MSMSVVVDDASVLDGLSMKVFMGWWNISTAWVSLTTLVIPLQVLGPTEFV